MKSLILKHDNNLDVAFEAMLILNLKSGLHVNGYWINSRSGQRIDKSQFIIEKSNLHNWKSCNIFAGLFTHWMPLEEVLK